MNASRLFLTLSAGLAILAGCGGSQPPIVGSRAMLQTSASSYRVLHRFGEDPDGSKPQAGLVAVSGNLYGTTTAGGIGRGTVFSVSTGGKESVLHTFGYHRDGNQPMASLIAIRDTLFGTTEFGRRGGTVFKLSTTGKNERVLHAFVPSGGTSPVANLLAVNGTLYGTTTDGGGPGNAGTVFGVTLHGKSHRVYAFTGPPDGQFPCAGLVDVNGVLYGTTFFGGAHDHGTVFSVSPTGNERVLYSFADNPDGADPNADLIDVDGTLYGTTTVGGTDGRGTIFRLTTTGKETVLYSFRGPPDGSVPYGGLVAANGTLYGATTQGGTGDPPIGRGTVFSIGTTGKDERVLHSFGGSPDGAEPYGSLLYADGTLYGTTYSGGKVSCGGGCGTVFALKP